MSSENDTSITVCLLLNVKEGGLLGLADVGCQFYFHIFFILTYSDSTLLTDMPNDIVHF